MTRRGRCGTCNHQCGGVFIDPDPDRQLFRHCTVFRIGQMARHPAPGSPPKIALDHVAKAFGDKQVLRDISLTVAAEESLAIIGTSGCGKSVTLKCLLGLLTADS